MKLLRNKKILLIIGIILIVVLIVVVNANSSTNKSIGNKDTKSVKFSCNVTASEEYKNLGEITYEQYQCLYESEEPFILILSQTECSYCDKFKPIINDYAKKEKLPVYVIEIDQLSDNDRSFLLSSLSYFDDDSNWGTPLTLIIKNKEVIFDLSGAIDNEADLEKLFSYITKDSSINKNTNEKAILYKVKLDDYDFWSDPDLFPIYKEKYVDNSQGKTVSFLLMLYKDNKCYYQNSIKSDSGSYESLLGDCTYSRQSNKLIVDGTLTKTYTPSSYEKRMGMESSSFETDSHFEFDTDSKGKYIKTEKMTYDNTVYKDLSYKSTKYILVDKNNKAYDLKGKSIHSNVDATGKDKYAYINLDDYQIVEK